MSDEKFRLPYTPALDGIRGIAILLVLGMHTQIAFLQGGFIGVEVFFVLSGFLITTILLKEFDTSGRIDFRNFYIRRFLRLFPALILMLIVLNTFTLLFQTSEIQTAALKGSLVTLFYLSNWVRALNLFDLVYLQHTWSLAIEEQFYIIFPLLLTTLLRLFSQKRVILIIAGLSLFSWLWRVVLTSQGATMARVNFGLDTRLDGLLMGCVLALVLASTAYRPLKQVMRRVRYFASFLALGACCTILYCAITANEAHALTYEIMLSLVSSSTCFLILYVVTIESSPIKSILEFKPLVLIGKISYGFYLLHWVFFNILVYFFRVSTITPGVAAAGTAIAFAASLLSYQLIERPVLRLKSRFGSYTKEIVQRQP